jgi:hypothetical protein
MLDLLNLRVYIYRWHRANLLEEGGYLNSQTPDTQIFGFSESQSTGGAPKLSADIASEYATIISSMIY